VIQKIPEQFLKPKKTNLFLRCGAPSRHSKKERDTGWTRTSPTRRSLSRPLWRMTNQGLLKFTVCTALVLPTSTQTTFAFNPTTNSREVKLIVLRPAQLFRDYFFTYMSMLSLHSRAHHLLHLALKIETCTNSFFLYPSSLPSFAFLPPFPPSLSPSSSPLPSL
jgi:hypothetical protein